MNQLDSITGRAVRRFYNLIADRYDIYEVIVFGSRARGTHLQHSDADVAVILRGEPQRFVTTKLEMADIAFDVLLETDVLISPLPISLEEWEHPDDYSNPELLWTIKVEGVWLHRS